MARGTRQDRERASTRGGRRKTSIEWPAAVDDRLRLLVRLAEEQEGLGVTSASELLGALIWSQQPDGAGLAATITSYRQAGRDVTGLADEVSPAGPRRTPRRGRPRRGRPRDDPGAGDTG